MKRDKEAEIREKYKNLFPYVESDPEHDNNEGSLSPMAQDVRRKNAKKLDETKRLQHIEWALYVFEIGDPEVERQR